MNKPLTIALLLACASSLQHTASAAEGDEKAREEKGPAGAAPATAGAPMKDFNFDCNAWTVGVPPKEVFVVDGTIKVASFKGSNALEIEASPIVDATAQLGDSAAGSASIEAKIFASKKGRSYPRFGLSVHGMSGYRAIVNCAKKQIELIKDDATVKAVPFAWTTDTWTHVKLEAKLGAGDTWTITAKAWADGATEPAEPLLTEAATKLKGQGKCAFWGTPFSEMPLYIDDVKISVAGK
jgi:hypothetical protein